MEKVLNKSFKHEKTLKNGLPAVEYIAEELSLLPHYLSNMPSQYYRTERTAPH